MVICDAGGTAQQKMALKVIAEYTLEPHEYELKYVEKNEIVTDVSLNEYREIIDAEQAVRLLHQGEYLASLQLLGAKNLDDKSRKPHIQLLKHVLY